MSETAGVQRFPATSGRFTGIAALLLCVGLVVVALSDGDDDAGAPYIWAACFFAVISYAAFLRPAVWVREDSVFLRNMIDTHQIPLAAVSEVVVRQVLALRAHDNRYVSPAIGVSFLRLRAEARSGPIKDPYPDFVTSRLLELADAARRELGDATPGPVRRTWAWPEIAGLLITLTGFVLAVLL